LKAACVRTEGVARRSVFTGNWAQASCPYCLAAAIRLIQ
jgi:hypothetical protein